eukprot:GILK01003442.1.p1 GENE.GILK01003442.1~~GILK01003442.1.p1  ORF type:complete len:305 (+),score=14.04 GILK01003442.1:50-916(+)
MEDQFAVLPHGKIYYRLVGPEDGKLVVCCHGIGGNSFQYDYISTHLASHGYRCLVFDYFCRGKSDNVAPSANALYDTPFYVSLVHELVTALGFHESPFIIIGYSLGGALAVAFTHTYPSLVEKLVLLAPAGLPGTLPPSAKLLRIPVLGSILNFIVKKIQRRKFLKGEVQHQGFFDPSKCPEAVAKSMEVSVFHTTHHRHFIDVFFQTVRVFELDSMLVRYQEVGVHGKPALVLWGSHDTTCPTSNAQIAAKALNADLVVVPDTGHAFVLEKPDVVGGHISEWLHTKA